MSSWRWLPLLLIATTAAAQDVPDGGEGEAAPPGCGRAIGPETARKLYAALAAMRGADGCVLDEVRTEGDTMHVSWKKPGAPVPAVEVRPSACSQATTAKGPEFSIAAPAAAAAACPVAVEKLTALVAGDSLGPAVRLGPRSFGRRRILVVVAGAAAALLAIAASAIWWRRRRTRAA
jgi:hypothetical protein